MMNPKVDFFFVKAKKFQEEMELMRTIALDSGLTEELKWGCPCYTLNGTNIVLIHSFKEYCAYLLFKGALLKDSEHILTQQTANVQSARQIRFTKLSEIVKLKKTIKAYIHEAVAVEKAGLKVELKKTKEFDMVEEFKAALKKNTALKKAFYQLTPGRQRAYLLFFAGAKQSKTREARIQKCTPDIMSCKGLND